jgi:hypothetical protein
VIKPVGPAPAGGEYVITSPTRRSATGTTSSKTIEPRSYEPVIEPLVMT